MSDSVHSHTISPVSAAPAAGAPIDDTSVSAKVAAGSSPQASASSTNSHSTVDQSKWSARRIAVYALFVAAAMALTFVEVPIFPAAPYLKYDPSTVVCIIAGFTFGPSAAAVVSVLSFVPHLFTNPFGSLIAILVSLLMSVPAAAVYRRKRTVGSAVLGLVLGLVLATAGAIVGNLIITPLYNPAITVQAVVGLIVPVLLPFNVLKAAINSVISLALLKPCTRLVASDER
ncbi:MAG: ECF transporter S component [Bifidobacteriaceae bacterium]|nr:ECF transporter S component [Bifidobacteriaceae bacterium]